MANRRADCWSLLIGARRVRARSPRFSSADDRRLEEITARHFPAGFTILRALGSWFDASRRKLVREESRQVLICGAGLHTIRRWALDLGRALNQREIVVLQHGRALRIRIGSG